MKQVALVTGASSGIGRATALKLLDAGYIVYVAARRADKLAELEEFGGIPLVMDVTKEEDVKDAMSKIMESYQGVDILVNNAGFALYGAVEDITIEQARTQFEVSMFGLARVTKAVLPYMRDVRSGKIINISSMGGKIYTPLGAWYHAAKHALEGWSDCLRLELKQFGIDVVIVEPGVINTEFADVLIDALIKTSGDGPYKQLAKKTAERIKESYSPGAGSNPSVVADTILKAIKSNNPKTRYAVGKHAKPSMMARKLLGDKNFDKIMMSLYK